MIDFGMLANALNTGALVPQIYKTLKSNSVSDMSYSWLMLSFIANVLWIVYAVRQKKGPQLMFMGCVFSLFYAFLIFVKFDSEKHPDGTITID